MSARTYSVADEGGGEYFTGKRALDAVQAAVQTPFGTLAYQNLSV